MLVALNFAWVISCIWTIRQKELSCSSHMRDLIIFGAGACIPLPTDTSPISRMFTGGYLLNLLVLKKWGKQGKQ